MNTAEELRRMEARHAAQRRRDREEDSWFRMMLMLVVTILCSNHD